MSPGEQRVREILSKSYGDLIDPKYAPKPEKAEAQLRSAVREIYREHGQHLPEWVKGYVKRWSAQDQGNDLPAVPGVTQGSAVAE